MVEKRKKTISQFLTPHRRKLSDFESFLHVYVLQDDHITYALTHIERELSMLFHRQVTVNNLMHKAICFVFAIRITMRRYGDEQQQSCVLSHFVVVVITLT
jgi:hypothetical protein